MDQRKSTLMIPHLPILTPLPQLTTDHEEQPEKEQAHQPEEEQVHQPEEEQVHQSEEEQAREEVIQAGVQFQNDQMSLEEIDQAVQHILETIQNERKE